MNDKLVYPFDAIEILRKYKSFRKELICGDNLIEKKVFVASGATTDEIIKILDVFLLNVGIKPVFLQGSYGLFFEDLAFENQALKEFNPDIIYIHSSFKNLNYIPDVFDTVSEVDDKLEYEFDRFLGMWTYIEQNYNCAIVQNNFELPPTRPLGNLENSHHSGLINFINRLNLRVSDHAGQNKNLYINDINYLSSFHGIHYWFSSLDWHRSKHSVSLKFVPYLAYNLSNIISALYGRSKKALVLDLDNTLWGGVIGDDGVSGIKIGHGSPTSEAFLEFQNYIKKLRNRGVLLSIVSKNEMTNALEGINHPEGILKESDFVAIKANWCNKADNIEEIAQELNVFNDALVFVDDNPAEREAVRQFLPEVAVLEMSDDISDYINILDRSGFFEISNLSSDDLNRNSSFKANKERIKFRKKSKNYEDYLLSLEMRAIIRETQGEYLDRISQLVNKTNQFNLTTKRYSSSEIYSFMGSEDHIVIYGSLDDKFGENGIISVMICNVLEAEIEIDTWVMSCRVFKRNMEYAMFDELVKMARKLGKTELKGAYIPSDKNTIVSNLYSLLGFITIEGASRCSDKVCYKMLINSLPAKNNSIRIINE